MNLNAHNLSQDTGSNLNNPVFKNNRQHNYLAKIMDFLNYPIYFMEKVVL